MTSMPFQPEDLEQAQKWILQGQVRSPLFSEGTYQIEVVDNGKSYWPFLQLSDAGEILDSFCTCPEMDKKSTCAHLAAAYLKIFHEAPFPLHVRFRDSLWNQLCLIASRRHGYQTHNLNIEKKYQALSLTGKLLFSLEPLNAEGQKKTQEMIDHREAETEETSLKFSNLSPEEILLWRQGQPSQKLRYELSFWSDLAKWCMLLQEEGRPYQIDFLPEGEDLPKWIQIRFDCMEVGFYIARANWPQLIPSLQTVHSPLGVFETFQRRIQQIRYEPSMQALFLDFEERESIEPSFKEGEEKGIDIDGWKFVPRKGFFSFRLDPVFHLKEIPKEKIDFFLNKHAGLFRKYLNEKIHEGSYKPQYHLAFDSNQCLHVQTYLFSIGDLTQPQAAFFGSWVYIPDKGFFHLDAPMFSEPEMIVPTEKISDFVNRHRTWLNGFEGFQIHLMTIEPRLFYHVSEEGCLSFSSQMDLAEDLQGVIDFGEWIFIPAKGFFPKKKEKMMPSLRAGLQIPEEDVAVFIRKHKEELRLLPNFFALSSPIEKMSLEVRLNEQKRINIRPLFTFLNPYQSKKVRFFREYTYVQEEGFTEIPYVRTFLEEYLKEKTLTAGEETLFVSRLESLQPWISYLDPQLTPAKKILIRIHDMKRDEESKIGKWVVDLQYESELGEVSLYEIWQAMQANKKHLFTPAGLIDLSSARFHWLKNISKKRWIQSGKKIRLNALEWISLQTLEDVIAPQGEGAKEKKIRAILEEFQNFQGFYPLNLDGLKSDLRNYQETGLKWLWFLYCYGLSGILCDEMGLGKTHQAMALLAAVKNAQIEWKQFLVVCPTSVLYHWEELLRKFAPHLKVHVFYGQGRQLEPLEKQHDVLLTSYGTLRSEKKQLSKRLFDVAIFDEIQNAKNSHSQTHRALKSLQAYVKIGLTGTPIENNILELKSLFDIILPYYLPSEAQFKELFVNPIEKSQDAERKSLLSKVIRPFVLRRKKSEVLLELPEKIEEIAYCDLSQEQKELYRQFFFSKKEEMQKDLRSDPDSTGFVHIFSLLSKLKQICNHPCLLTKDYDQFLHHHSGKWDLFVELLQEARDSKQKIVVFTQYLDMMDMIETYLTKENIGFAEIRGSTRDRREPLRRFKEDPLCEIFVASLQAAGVGIDLTSASVVIHYDRWWNPAKENQATDRVHRMGQSRGVQVFKLVTKRTVEERIHELIEKKKGLLEEVIRFDDQDAIKGLTKQEIFELLSVLEKDIETSN
jgi:SNF2 family DNA or RNA helicase